jgi:inhibitor of KinA sporulation pathway (predicted exonuclease)
METLPKDSNFDYLLVLDFEAQCIEGEKLECQEIIEFPVLIIDVKEQIVNEKFFHTYVKPVVHPKLTDFCKELTGIEQEWVDQGVLLVDALKYLDQFLEKNGLLDKRFTFITCGDWDLSTCLRKECFYKGIEYKEYLCKWINVKRLYEEYTGGLKGGMKGMLEHLGIPLEGRHHSGIDDSRNIAKIVLHLIKNGMRFTEKYESKNKILKAKDKKIEKVNEKNIKKEKKAIK